MRRRPLCMAAILLLLILWILPGDIWLKQPDIPSGESVRVTGTVTKREQKNEKQVYYLKKCLCEQTDSEFSMLAYLSEGESYPIGCTLSLEGTIYQLNIANNPGQFDANQFYQSQGILYTFQVERVVSAEGKSYLRELVAEIKENLKNSLQKIYGDRDAGILSAILLGDKSLLREEDQLLYQKNGISHVLAISGLHISMIGISLYRLLRKWNFTFLEAGVPSGVLLLFYGMMTGFGISTIRAICMFLIMIFGDVLGRAYDMASAMALAAMIILIRNPLQARQAGFLLSFGAVVGICVVYPILKSVFSTKKKFLQTLLLSCSLALVTYPLSVHFFYEYSFYSMVLNFIVIPCMPLLMGTAGAGMLLGCIAPKAGAFIGIPAHLVLSFYEYLGYRVLGLPFSVIRLGGEEPWQLLVYYSLLAAALLILWYGRRPAAVCLIPLALVLVTVRLHGKLEITVLDVGQGDGIFLRFPGGTTCLIDGGSTNVKNVGKYRLLPYLKYEGVECLDYVILSHLDEDHMNGIRELLEMSEDLDGVKIKTLFFPDLANPDDCYKELWTLAEQSGVATKKIGAGDQLREEALLLECIYPQKNSAAEDKNEFSAVLQLHYGEFSMLFSGDLGWEGEQALLEAGSLIDVDVWKVSHHGSKYSGCEPFLECIRANVSLISVGKNNYGHPSTELLERLSCLGSRTFATIDTGAIMLESDGRTYTINLQSPSD